MAAKPPLPQPPVRTPLPPQMPPTMSGDPMGAGGGRIPTPYGLPAQMPGPVPQVSAMTASAGAPLMQGSAQDAATTVQGARPLPTSLPPQGMTGGRPMTPPMPVARQGTAQAAARTARPSLEALAGRMRR